MAFLAQSWVAVLLGGKAACKCSPSDAGLATCCLQYTVMATICVNRCMLDLVATFLKYRQSSDAYPFSPEPPTISLSQCLVRPRASKMKYSQACLVLGLPLSFCVTVDPQSRQPSNFDRLRLGQDSLHSGAILRVVPRAALSPQPGRASPGVPKLHRRILSRILNKPQEPSLQTLRKRTLSAGGLPWKTALPAAVRAAEKALNTRDPARRRKILEANPASQSVFEISQRHGISPKQMERVMTQKYKIWDRQHFPQEGRDSAALSKVNDLAAQHLWMPELDRSLHMHMLETAHQRPHKGLTSIFDQAKKASRENRDMTVHRESPQGGLHQDATLSPEEEMRRHLEREKAAGTGGHPLNAAGHVHHETELSPEEEVRQHLQRVRERERDEAKQKEKTSTEHYKETGNHIRRVQMLAEQQKKGNTADTARTAGPPSGESLHGSTTEKSSALRIERNYRNTENQHNGGTQGTHTERQRHSEQHQKGRPQEDWAQSGWGEGAPSSSGGSHHGSNGLEDAHSHQSHASGKPIQPPGEGASAHPLTSGSTLPLGTINPNNPFTGGSGASVVAPVGHGNHPSHTSSDATHQQPHNAFNPFTGPNAVQQQPHSPFNPFVGPNAIDASKPQQ